MVFATNVPLAWCSEKFLSDFLETTFPICFTEGSRWKILWGDLNDIKTKPDKFEQYNGVLVTKSNPKEVLLLTECAYWTKLYQNYFQHSIDSLKSFGK